MSNSPHIQHLCEQLAGLLVSRQWKLASAESCTGGLIAKTCTDLPGSSAWFDSALVTYSNTSKQRLLAVPQVLLAAHGAVSEPVVRAMLQGLFSHTDADIGVAVTGIAGPGGGSADKPVGTVWLSVGTRTGELQSELLQLAGNRAEIRENTLEISIKTLIKLINEQS